ncbi:MAG: NYN domain-containing protein [Bacteroidota bacterium]|nr:NYN domain-containing protein [Bacteroidota bacterium]
MGNKLIKIGVFYDGGFFWHVSNYYNYVHSRGTRISITGLHEFIRHQAAQFESTDLRYCHIVDAHYFRGRYSAYEAQNRNKLLADRLFDDVLMKEGIITHFLPFSTRGEKGIDVWFALECYELAINKQFDVVAMVASDGDYIPLIRKLNTLGVRVMVLGWDFEFTDQEGVRQKTATSVGLMDEATYPILMHNLIDDKTKRNDSIVNALFVPDQPSKLGPIGPVPSAPTVYDDSTHTSQIVQLYNGYGFIATDNPQKHLFFHYSELENVEFQTLVVGDEVEFKHGYNDRGECAVEINKVGVEAATEATE